MLDSWIEVYGPWAVLVGGIFEGEAVFMAAGYAISQGYLDPFTTFILAVAGGSLGDTVCYVVGRSYGPRITRTVPFLQKVRARAVLMLRRWGRATAFLMRFAYGLRIILPISVGAARFPWPTFLSFNLLGSITFASVYLLLGYFFGEALEELLAKSQGYEWWGLVGIGVVGLIIWAIREWRIYHVQKEPNLEDDLQEK